MSVILGATDSDARCDLTGADGDVWFHHIVPTATAVCLRT
jgi:hypothetical protein